MLLVNRNLVIKITNTQPAFASSKLTTKYQKKTPNMLKIDNKGTGATPISLNTDIVKLSKYSRKQ